MVKVRFKENTVEMYCFNAEELHTMYFNLGNILTFIVDGEELKRIDAQFVGYTRSFFKKYFK